MRDRGRRRESGWCWDEHGSVAIYIGGRVSLPSMWMHLCGRWNFLPFLCFSCPFSQRTSLLSCYKQGLMYRRNKGVILPKAQMCRWVGTVGCVARAMYAPSEITGCFLQYCMETGPNRSVIEDWGTKTRGTKKELHKHCFFFSYRDTDSQIFVLGTLIDIPA